MPLRTLGIENIPGAWRVHGTEQELPGEGRDQVHAILSFFGNNAGKQLSQREVCAAHVLTVIKRARPEQINKGFIALMKALTEM